MNKDLVLSFLLAIGIVGGSLYGFFRYSLHEDEIAAAKRAAVPRKAALPGPAQTIDPCPGGKMLQGECHVRKPDQPNTWIRKDDLLRPKAQPAATMNVASGGITENERRRLAEFEQQRRVDEAARDQLIAQQVAQPGPGSDKDECDRIEREIKSVDAATRQALPGQLQDYYRGRRKDLRDQQAHLRC